jgi:hypothetical protein
MNCSTHGDVAAVAFCRSCGKPLCGNCTRDVRGVIYCEPCLAARLEGTAPPAAAFVPPVGAPGGAPQQTIYQQGTGLRVPPVRPAGSGPNPAIAGILAGFFPFGVGAVYCSQYAKGLAHLLIFALLIFATDHAGRWDFIFGIGIAFFYVYQIIDSVKTARAMQEGQAPPDPFGLSQAFSFSGERSEGKNIPSVAIVLIVLGVLFMLHTMDIGVGLDRFWPLLLIVFGGWTLAKQLGVVAGRHWVCPCDRCRTRRIMGPAIVLTIGILFQLQTLDVVDFDRTWPAILLVVGIVKLIQSNASSEGHVGSLPPGPPSAAPPPPSAPSQNPAPSDAAPSSSDTTASSGEVHNV